MKIALFSTCNNMLNSFIDIDKMIPHQMFSKDSEQINLDKIRLLKYKVIRQINNYQKILINMNNNLNRWKLIHNNNLELGSNKKINHSYTTNSMFFCLIHHNKIIFQ